MLGRIAARVVTGPLAFLLGGVIDVLTYAATSARARLRIRRPGSNRPVS